MESGGKPGKIHITYDTLHHLDGKYTVEDGHGEERDEMIRSRKIKTYFIIERIGPIQKATNEVRSENSKRKGRPSKKVIFTLARVLSRTRTFSPTARKCTHWD